MSSEHDIAGNQITLLQNGAEFFPRLSADIDAARERVFLETYIFMADETGGRVARALQDAAARGVTVRVLLDGFGSSGLPQDWVEQWRAAGVNVLWFRREVSFFRLRRHRLRRLHRKLVSIDGDIAYAGGINMMDDVPLRPDLTLPQLDYAVRLQGRAAEAIEHTMQHLWGVVSWASLHRRGSLLWPTGHAAPPHDSHDQLALVVRDNLRHRRDIERAYLSAIAAARHEIVLANAYFLPGKVFRRALRQAAQRGVRVVLLLQGKTEYLIQHYATRFLYGEFLAAGIEVYEYQPSYLHAKVAVIDTSWATVGSSNIDPFSLLLAREANLIINDAGFAQSLRASLMAVLASESLRVQGTSRNYLFALVPRLSYGLIRFLLGMVGYSRRH
jgi:cardiolipin synthase